MRKNILHFLSKPKNKICDENSNTLLNIGLINESEHPHSSSTLLTHTPHPHSSSTLLIHTPHQAALERTYKLEAKREIAKYLENMIEPT